MAQRFPQLFCLRNVLAARQADLKILRGAEGRPTGEVAAHFLRGFTVVFMTVFYGAVFGA